MATVNKMCPYQNKGKGGSRRNAFMRSIEVPDKYFEQKRVRVKCPKCGRRMIGWAMISHDAEVLWYAIPPHKRKKWWKRK